MIERREHTIPKAPWSLELHDAWCQTRSVIRDGKLEWLKANIRDSEFFHLTVMGHNGNFDDGILEWIAEQPECSLGTVLYTYVNHFSKDRGGLDWFYDDSVQPYYKRRVKMVEGIARRLRDGLHPDIGFQLLGGGAERYRTVAQDLEKYLSHMDPNHPLSIPLETLEADLITPARNHFSFEFDEDGIFCTSYDAWYWYERS